MEKHTRIKLLLLMGLLLISILVSLLYGGSESINFNNLSPNNFVFWNIRFPKTITAIIAGCTLSVAGLILQIIFRNPLAGPYVLGISSGASLMVAISFLAGNSLHILSNVFAGKLFLVASAIIGSLFITGFILTISKRVSSNVVLLLIGLMLSQICGAIQSVLEYFSDASSLKSFVIWGMGSLNNTTNFDLFIYLPIAFVFLTALFFLVKPLNALLLGENYAQNSGVNYSSSRFYLILISSVLTGVTTAFCGPIAFVGISVPILSRMLFKSANQQLHIVTCLLIGSITLLLADALANSVLKNVSLPINMITTIIGAPLVIYLMFKNKNW